MPHQNNLMFLEVVQLQFRVARLGPHVGLLHLKLHNDQVPKIWRLLYIYSGSIITKFGGNVATLLLTKPTHHL